MRKRKIIAALGTIALSATLSVAGVASSAAACNASMPYRTLDYLSTPQGELHTNIWDARKRFSISTWQYGWIAQRQQDCTYKRIATIPLGKGENRPWILKRGIR